MSRPETMDGQQRLAAERQILASITRACDIEDYAGVRNLVLAYVDLVTVARMDAT